MLASLLAPDRGDLSDCPGALGDGTCRAYWHMGGIARRTTLRLAIPRKYDSLMANIEMTHLFDEQGVFGANGRSAGSPFSLHEKPS